MSRFRGELKCFAFDLPFASTIKCKTNYHQMQNQYDKRDRSPEDSGDRSKIRHDIENFLSYNFGFRTSNMITLEQLGAELKTEKK